ncbi:MAG: SDR family oxidoreductase [Rhodospirillaceae bacterium]|nr:SDR family oxidoreductase [Rhodospirillaceae bacterium]MBT4115625.1 SDR family oxidoreductase [Rhodospirillaceae bacterium]MBT4671331.1 SDR family oxidoreductase [Rhodospirillaceae bacterium]MBT4721826.1 SDR family oxidoreductase [Rhodospirillaceae bacterium]MBT4750876.1 SDR family oxidoreductase [Rhodospirillaceae bacterium]
MSGSLLGAKSVIVTGGGRGLGREMSLALLAAGASVTAAARSADQLDSLAEAAKPLPGSLQTITADIRLADDCAKIVAAANAAFGAVHVLINNAGLTMAYIYPGRHLRQDTPKFWEVSDATVEDVMATNFLGADRLVRMVAADMVAQGWGRIISLTTKIEIMNRAASAPYGGSKAALEMTSEVWMKDLEGTGVTVNVLNPGAADTDGFASREERELVAKKMPLIDPARIGAPVVWLASDASDGVTGRRFDTEFWEPGADAEEQAKRTGSPMGFDLKTE